MRPLRVQIEAFGAFADRQVVDFEALGADRLFLVHGPTGAGKSTLLEAICFALYGAPAGTGDGPAVQHLRSQHAAPDRPTRVVFDFALGDARYRIERAPRQLRPKRRGDRLRRRSRPRVAVPRARRRVARRPERSAGQQGRRGRRGDRAARRPSIAPSSAR